METKQDRDARLHDALSARGPRTAAQHDRDRVLYSGAFRRLAGVTQVAGPLENYIFHTRLTHSLEVAQIARRTAERLIQEGAATSDEPLWIDPDVVETAALIHDLGHPPFGHVAENELDDLARRHHCPDGFEGNAQSFHIVTQLASHRTPYRGLNLSRATLNAALKYPWLRELHNQTSPRYKKFGSYIEDNDAFQFARRGSTGDEKSLEAQIMDFSDDVAYSVHDLVDFYCAGLLPLETLLYDKKEFRDFIEWWKNETYYTAPEHVDAEETHFRQLLQPIVVPGTWIGSFNQRAELKTATSQLISEFVLGVSVTQEAQGQLTLIVAPERQVEIQFLKQIIWYYVICNPRLATQQEGHKRAISTLFETYSNAVVGRNRTLIPGRFRGDLDGLPKNEKDPQITRLALDIIAGLTDSQAVAMYRRISGIELGELSDLVAY